MVQWVALTPGFDSWPRYSPHCYHRAHSGLAPCQAGHKPRISPATMYNTLLHLSILANTLGQRRNRRHFADDIFKCIFLNGNVWISIKNSLPALVQIMVRHLILHIISISLHIHKVNTIPADALSPGHQKPWYQGLLFWCTKNDLISLSVQHIYNKTGVERRQTLGPLRSVNPNMINYFIKQLPLLFSKSYTCCLDMNL